MKFVQVVTGAEYEAMHAFTRPLFAQRWGVIVTPVRPAPGEHWTHTKIRHLLSGPVLLIDCDVLPLSKPPFEHLWNALGYDLHGVREDTGQHNTGLVYAPPKLSERNRLQLELALRREYRAPLWEQDQLQRCQWQTLDSRWARLTMPGLAETFVYGCNAWSLHFAGKQNKLECMRHVNSELKGKTPCQAEI